MADVSVGTARGVVRIDYESRGATRVTREFESVKRQAEDTATSFATWADKIGIGGQQLQRLSQIQRAVVEAQKTANYFALQRENLNRLGNVGLSEQIKLMRLANQSQKSLVDITKVAREANKKLPMELAKAGQESAKAFSNEFERHAVAKFSSGASSGGMGSVLGGALAMGMKSGIAAALSVAVGALAGGGAILAGGFGRLTGIDTATYKLQALGFEGKKVEGIMQNALEAVQGTQYSLDQAVTVAAGAVQAGIKPGNNLVAYLKDIQGLASVAQMDLQTVGQLMNRVQVEKGVSGEILSQLEYVGVNIMPMLAKEYGKTEAAMAQMRERGEIDAEHFNAAIRNNFGDAADIMGQSLSGAIGNMKTSFSRLGAGILAPIFSPVGDKPAIMVNVINGIKKAVEGLINWFDEHQKGLIDFWVVMGRAAIVGGGIIVDAVGIIVGAIATLSKGVSWLTRAVAWGFDIFGGDGIAENIRGAADSISEFGNDAYGAAGKLFGLNSKLIDGWNALGEFGNKAKEAADAEKTFAESAEENAQKQITVTEAIGKLGKTIEDAQQAIEGSQEGWEKFLKTLKEKGATEELLKTLKGMREEFNNGGRAAKEYSKALAQMGDTSVSASSKAESLINSLKKLGILPGEASDALSQYNSDLRGFKESNEDLVNVLDMTGNALIRQNGEINTSYGNGEKLKGLVETVRQNAYALAATGEYSPSDIWQKTHDELVELLKRFSITGVEAEKLINKYLLPKHDFEIQFLVRGKDELQQDLTTLETQLGTGEKELSVHVSSDPNEFQAVLKSLGLEWLQYDELTKTAKIAVPSELDIAEVKARIDRMLNEDSSKLESEIKVITSAQDVVDQINNGNPLKIPAVLDFSATDGKLPEVEVPKSPVEPRKLPNNLPAPTEIFPVPGSPNNQTTSPTVPDIAPYDRPEDVIPLPNSPKSSTEVPDIAPWDTGGGMSNLIARARGEITAKLLAPNMILEKGAQNQGYNFGKSFAQGIRDSIPDVLEAALKIAEASTDPLGHSPAKVGPLAGSGWTYFRGRTYSEAYAEGIAAGQQAVGGAALSIANSSVDPLTDGFARMMRDASEWLQFGKHIFDMVSQVTDIGFNVLNLAQTLTGGKLFPKTYKRDPNRPRKEPKTEDWMPSPFPTQADQSSSVTPSPSAAVAPSSLSKNASKQEVANYIINKALSLGYSRKQANDFVVQAFGESGLNPKAFGANTGDSSGGAQGIFQFTPGTWGNRSGSPMDAQANIDAYFDLARERGLTPENFTAGRQLGTQVSIGGPWHPQNELQGHLYNALIGAKPFIEGYTGSTPSGLRNFAPKGVVPKGVSRASLLGGAGSTYSKGFVQAKGLNPLYTPGEYSYGSGGLPQWVYDFAAQFGLQAASNVSASGADSLHGAGLAFDFSGPQENMTKMAEYIQQNLAEQTLQLIYQDSKTGRKYGLAGGQNVGSGSGSPYYDGEWGRHNDHVHWGTDVPVGGGYAPLSPAQRVSGREPVPVSLGRNSIDPQANSGTLPVDPSNPLGIPPGMLDIANADSTLLEAIQAAKGVGGVQPDEQISTYLQHLDGLIADRQFMTDPVSKEQTKYLGDIRAGLMNQYAMQEGPTGLDTAQTVTQNISGLASDVFGIVDSSLKSVSASKEIGDTLVRGIENTESIYKIIENIQPFIELGGKIAQTASDALGFAGQMAAFSGGQDAGATSAALSAASSIAGIISQSYAAVNAAIDLGQEAYRIGTKYLGRALQNWFGLPGATDIKYLLDTMNGQLQVYTSENPQMKSSFNTFGREMGVQYQGRQAPTNNLYVYQGPGQDPRDTMNDAMFMIKSSGAGAFGYAS